VLTDAWLEGTEHGDWSWVWEHRSPDRNGPNQTQLAEQKATET
jgi:hypothetical protein